MGLQQPYAIGLDFCPSLQLCPIGAYHSMDWCAWVPGWSGLYRSWSYSTQAYRTYGQYTAKAVNLWPYSYSNTSNRYQVLEWSMLCHIWHRWLHVVCYNGSSSTRYMVPGTKEYHINSGNLLASSLHVPTANIYALEFGHVFKGL